MKHIHKSLIIRRTVQDCDTPVTNQHNVVHIKPKIIGNTTAKSRIIVHKPIGVFKPPPRIITPIQRSASSGAVVHQQPLRSASSGSGVIVHQQPVIASKLQHDTKFIMSISIMFQPFNAIDYIVDQKWRSNSASNPVHILSSSQRHVDAITHSAQKESVFIGDLRADYTIISLDPSVPSFILIVHKQHLFDKICIAPVSSQIHISNNPISIIGTITSGGAFVYAINHCCLVSENETRISGIAQRYDRHQSNVSYKILDSILNTYGVERTFIDAYYNEIVCVRKIPYKKISPFNLCPRTCKTHAFCAILTDMWKPNDINPSNRFQLCQGPILHFLTEECKVCDAVILSNRA